MLETGKKVYTIKEVFYPHLVLAESEQDEKLFFGYRIGEGHQPGSTLEDLMGIDRAYTVVRKDMGQISDEESRNVVGICSDIIHQVGQDLGEEMTPRLFDALCSHLYQMVNHLQSGEQRDNPYRKQTRILYQKEYDVAEKVVYLLEDALDVKIPEDEIGFIAMNIHTARGGEGITSAIFYAFIANSVTQMLEEALEKEFDKSSMDYIRFIVHLQFAVQRIMEEKYVPNVLLRQIKQDFSASYAFARKIADFLESQTGKKVNEDETGFLAIYVERLREI